MNDDEILEELGKMPHHQQQMTERVWELAGSMRVCWICGDDEADERQLNNVRGYLCGDCYFIQCCW